MLRAQFPCHEGDEADDTDDQAGEGECVVPAALGTFVDTEDDGGDTDRREQRPHHVEATAVVLTTVRHHPQHDREGDDTAGDRQREDPRPGRVVDDVTGDEQSEDATAGGEAGPHTDGLRPLLGGEAGRDDRERDRHDHGRTDPGDDPGRQQDRARGGHRRDQVGAGEDGETRHQDGLAAETVADGADGQQQRSQGHRVAVDDPQQRALRSAEVGGELLLGDVEAGHGRNDGDQCGAHRDEDEPLPPWIGDDGVEGFDGHGGLLRIGTTEQYETVSFCSTKR